MKQWMGLTALLTLGLVWITTTSGTPPPTIGAGNWPGVQPLAAAEAPVSRAAHAAMVTIPAASHTIGHDDGPADQRPSHTVELGALKLDPVEVTNAAFAEFLNALTVEPQGQAPAGRVGVDNFKSHGGAFVERFEGSGAYPIIALDDAQARIGVADGRFVVTPGYEDHPVTETTWAGAAAYCVWRGGHLPSEAQWEAAARWPDGRLYPWGSEPPLANRVYTHPGTGHTAKVGSRPAGASELGLLDMAGSLAEWTSTLKAPYPYDPNDGREDPTIPGERVTRGGDYHYDDRATTLTTTHRDGFSNAPARGHRHIGFRCAAPTTDGA